MLDHVSDSNMNNGQNKRVNNILSRGALETRDLFLYKIITRDLVSSQYFIPVETRYLVSWFKIPGLQSKFCIARDNIRHLVSSHYFTLLETR